MAILNQSDITSAIESILRAGLDGYIITRNEPINSDPGIARLVTNGWIGIYRGKESYVGYCTGSTPWLVDVDPRVVIQAVSLKNGETAESILQGYVEEVLDVLNSNKRLNNTIANSIGYEISYQFNDQNQIYFHQATIIIKGQTRA